MRQARPFQGLNARTNGARKKSAPIWMRALGQPARTWPARVPFRPGGAAACAAAARLTELGRGGGKVSNLGKARPAGFPTLGSRGWAAIPGSVLTGSQLLEPMVIYLGHGCERCAVGIVPRPSNPRTGGETLNFFCAVLANGTKYAGYVDKRRRRFILIRDRRRHLRFCSREDAIIVELRHAAPDAPEESRTIFCTTDNLSTHGVRLALDTIIPVHSPVRVTVLFKEPARRFDHLGHVRWLHKDERDQRITLGIEFSNDDPSALATWRAFLAETSSGRSG